MESKPKKLHTSTTVSGNWGMERNIEHNHASSNTLVINIYAIWKTHLTVIYVYIKFHCRLKGYVIHFVCTGTLYIYRNKKEKQKKKLYEGKKMQRRKRENITRYIINFVLQLLMMRVQCSPFYGSYGGTDNSSRNNFAFS